MRNQSELDNTQYEVLINELLNRGQLNELNSLEFDFDLTFQRTHQTLPWLEEFYDMMLKPFCQTQLNNLQKISTLSTHNLENV